MLFAIMLVLPVLNDVFGIFSFERADENRAFKSSLELDVAKLDAFPNEANQYINDNFAFRAPLLDVFHEVKYSFFGVSPNPEKTIVGKEGWFFMGGKDLDIYLGKLDFSEDQLQAFTTEWNERSAYFDSLGIKHYWVVPPLKHTVYEEVLPNNVVRRKTPSRIETIKQQLMPTHPLLITDPADKLQEAKASHKLFYVLDNHWNFRAGAIASEQVMAQITSDFPSASIPSNINVSWMEEPYEGGIHRKVIGVDGLEEFDVAPNFGDNSAHEIEKYGFESPSGFVYPWEYEHRYVNPFIEKGTGLRALIIRDSFGEQMMPFLSQSFEESVFIFDAWRYKVDKEIIETVNPDIIIYISVESLLEEFIIER